MHTVWCTAKVRPWSICATNKAGQTPAPQVVRAMRKAMPSVQSLSQPIASKR